MEHAATTEAPVRFETEPDRYIHWKLEVEAPIERVVVRDANMLPSAA